MVRPGKSPTTEPSARSRYIPGLRADVMAPFQPAGAVAGGTGAAGSAGAGAGTTSAAVVEAGVAAPPAPAAPPPPPAPAPSVNIPIAPRAASWASFVSVL